MLWKMWCLCIIVYGTHEYVWLFSFIANKDNNYGCLSIECNQNWAQNRLFFLYPNLSLFFHGKQVVRLRLKMALLAKNVLISL